MAENTSGALSVIRTLQNKVGTSLTNVQNLLPRGESDAVILQSGAAAVSAGVLLNLTQGISQVVDAVKRTNSILLDQYNFQVDADRRAREQAAELAKEGGTGDLDFGAVGTLDDIEKKSGFNFADFLPAFGAAIGAWLATQGGIRGLATKLAKRIFRVGFWFTIADIITDTVGEEVDKYIKDPQFKKEVHSALDKIPWVVGGYMLFGLPGAIAALIGTGLKSAYDFLMGKQPEMTGTDWASIGLGGIGMWWMGTKLAAFAAANAGTFLGGAATLGAAVLSAPVLIAAGLALALAAGGKWMMNKLDKYNALTLANLNQMTKLSDAEFSKRLAQQEENWLEAMGLYSLSNLFGKEGTNLNKALSATKGAKDAFKDKKLTEADQMRTAKLADKMINVSQADLEELMKDKTKTEAFSDTLKNLVFLAQNGALGPDSKEILKKLLLFGNRMQGTAEKLVIKDKFDRVYLRKMMYDPNKKQSDFMAQDMHNYRLGTSSGYVDAMDILGKYMGFKEQGEADLAFLQKHLEEIKQWEAEGGSYKYQDTMGLFGKDKTELYSFKSARRKVELMIKNAEQRLKRGESYINQSVGFGIGGLNYNDLRKLFTEEELKQMIKQSMTPFNPSSYIVPEKKSEMPPAIIQSGSNNTTTTTVQGGGITYIKPLADGDMDPGLKRAISGYDNAPY